MPDEITEVEKQEEKESKDDHNKMYDMDSGPISFSEMQSEREAKEAAYKVQDLAYEFPHMVKRIINRSDIEDKDAALAILSNEFISFAQDALSQSDTKEKWQPLTNSLAKLKDKVMKVATKEESRQDSFSIWYNKETDQWRWLAIYSNNYRDNDNPPEIISKASHEQFNKAVNAGEVPYPELWLWHIPGSQFGQADWHHYTDDGFAIASGYVDKGKEQVAKGLAAYNDELLTSHGMPKTHIQRDTVDKSIITRHITREISPLPASAAANKLTSFEVLNKKEGEQVAIPKDKKEFLKQVGMSDADIEQIETSVKDKATQAEEAGLEKKEETTQEPELTPEAIVKAISTVITPLAERIESLEIALKELSATDEEKIAKKAADLPKNSLEYLAQKEVESLFSQGKQVDGRSTLAKSGPKETPVQKEEQGLFFSQWLQPAGVEND